MKIYALRDLQADCYESIFTSVNDSTASRDMKAYLKQKSKYSDFSEDFDLYCLADLDTNTGNVFPKLTKVCSLKLLVEDEKNA